MSSIVQVPHLHPYAHCRPHPLLVPVALRVCVTFPPPTFTASGSKFIGGKAYPDAPAQVILLDLI